MYEKLMGEIGVKDNEYFSVFDGARYHTPLYFSNDKLYDIEGDENFIYPLCQLRNKNAAVIIHKDKNTAEQFYKKLYNRLPRYKRAIFPTIYPG